MRQTTGHLPQGQLDGVGAWLVQLGFVHYQRVDLSFLWEMGEGDNYGGEGTPPISTLSSQETL